MTVAPIEGAAAESGANLGALEPANEYPRDPTAELHAVADEKTLGVKLQARLRVGSGERSRETILPVSLEQDGARSRIRLEGAIDIGCAQELKSLLVEGLRAGTELRVQWAEVTDLDITAVQLLGAAERAAGMLSVGFGFEGQAPGAILAALADAGFENFAASGETR